MRRTLRTYYPFRTGHRKTGSRYRPCRVGEALDGTWDAFISHASEDKGYVRELAAQLTRLGVRVWYDEFELRPGDSLVASIDKGLASSRFGVLILTPAFLGKPWTEYERRGLT